MNNNFLKNHGETVIPRTNAPPEQQKPGSKAVNRPALNFDSKRGCVHQQGGYNSLKRWPVGVYIFCMCDCDVGAA